MIWYVLVGAASAAALVGIAATIFRKASRARLVAMFRRYNEAEDPKIVIDWIRAGNFSQRLLQTIEYLDQIEAYELAKTVLDAFAIDEYPQRHTRIFASRIYDRRGEHELACQIAHRLMAAFPADDGMLSLYVDVHLNAGRLEEAKRLLLPRLEHKYKGTDLKRLHARLLAAEGKHDEAIEIMEDVVKRDYMLHRNTVAPLDRRLIYEQWQTSAKLLETMKIAAGYIVEDEVDSDADSENGEPE